LAEASQSSVDAFVLLDAQDWMTDAQLNALWAQITRTARPGARVIFRTADEPTLLPGRVDEAVLSRWSYDADRSRELTAQDRSAIYGGFHLYRFAG
jgi:S-adenosylmethionine-diacylglycerol 3-amino-3-carboxypropyl transferase